MQSFDSSDVPIGGQARQIGTKKKQAIQRQARLFNVPTDILSKIPAKKSSQATPQQQSPHFSPQSVPSAYASSPQVGGYGAQLDQTSQHFMFVNYSDHPKQQNPNTIIINNMPRDVNEVIEEIIKSRPPANPIHKNEISFVCPFSMVPITCPGRGVNCQHGQCFDLREFLLAQLDDSWMCPICGLPIPYEQLRFDPFFFRPLSSNTATPAQSPSQDPNPQVDPWSDYSAMQLF